MATTQEQRTKVLMDKLDPLVDWMKRYKPDRKEIHVYKKDFEWLKTLDSTLRIRGVYKSGDNIVYRDYILLPFETI